MVGGEQERVHRDEIPSSTEGPPHLSITPRDLRIEMVDDAGIVSSTSTRPPSNGLPPGAVTTTL